MGLKYKMYCFLVNRNPAVKERYEGYVRNHSDKHKKYRIISWMYLFWLNICSPFLKEKAEFVPETVRGAESEKSFSMSPWELADKLCESDIVSFDVFDTLIFRPFSDPRDVFYLVGQKLSHPDFKGIRCTAEWKARQRDISEGGKGEIDLYDIYDVVEEMTGIAAELGADTEMETELSVCCANPYMQRVWKRVLENGRRIVVVSDMYLSSEFIAKLLAKNGFSGYEKIYVSCEYGCGKHDKGLYKIVKSEHEGSSFSHTGDNYASDLTNASATGFRSVHYPNVNQLGESYRTRDMSPIMGSAYRGLVNKKLYCGDERYSMQYEYGYKHGGLLVLGFCQYIRKISVRKNCDKVLFFSRDGYIIERVYRQLYPDSNVQYVYWSRNAAARLSFDIMPYDYFRRFVYQKTGRGLTFAEVLGAAGLSCSVITSDGAEVLTEKNADRLCSEIRQSSKLVQEVYADMNTAAKRYFTDAIGDSRNILTVDCGWAGSGDIILEKLIKEKWGLDCNVYGVVAGTNGAKQHDSDFSETYFADGRLSSYCFSSLFNRDIYKSHRPSEKHNVYFEMLLGAPEPSFLGFGLKGDEIVLLFDKECENEETVREIHKGELDYVKDHLSAFSKYEILMDISGSDAYAVFGCALLDKSRYAEAVMQDCVFDELTGCRKEKI